MLDDLSRHTHTIYIYKYIFIYMQALPAAPTGPTSSEYTTTLTWWLVQHCWGQTTAPRSGRNLPPEAQSSGWSIHYLSCPETFARSCCICPHYAQTVAWTLRKKEAYGYGCVYLIYYGGLIHREVWTFSAHRAVEALVSLSSKNTSVLHMRSRISRSPRQRILQNTEHDHTYY